MILTDTQRKPKSVEQTIHWLESNNLPPLPVAPKQDAYQHPKIERGKHGEFCPLQPDSNQPQPLFNGKNPSYLDPEGVPHLIKHSKFRKRKPTHAEKQAWWANPANGIGTLAGVNGINWIDLDRKRFEAQSDCDNGLAQILERVPKTYYEQTLHKGYHVAVKLSIPKDFTNFALSENEPHIGEFLGKGRFVVLAPTDGYESLNGREIANAVGPTSLGLWPTKGNAATFQTGVKRVPLGQAVTGKTPPKNQPQSAPQPSAEHPENPALVQLISKRNQAILQGGEYPDRSAALAGFARDCYGWENFLGEKGWGHSGQGADALIEQAAEALGITDKADRCLQGVNRATCRPALEYAGKHRPQAYYVKLCQHSVNPPIPKKGSTLGKIKRIRAIYGNRVRLNLLNQKIEIDGSPVEEVEDEHIYYIEATGHEVGVELFCRTVRLIAKENAYNPVIEYLESVAQTGGDPSIFEGVAKRHFGVDNPLYDTYVKRWMISAVARAYEPGCKADCALFLQGVQGAKKSSFFEKLAGAPFFDNNLGDVKNNKDELLILHRAWIHEWSELETAFKKKDISEVKSFVARSMDIFRPPYGRQPVDMARRSILCGSTNQQEFLADETGERRFWIIPVKTQKINLAAVASERDALWAAAVALYHKGEQWWLTDEEELQSKALSARFKSLDPWHDAISEWVSGREYVKVNDILTLGFDLDLNKINRTEQRRVSSVLTSLGWESGQKKINGKNTKVWFPPETEPKPEPEPEHPKTAPPQTELPQPELPAEIYEALDGSLPPTVAGAETVDWYLRLMHCQSWDTYSTIYQALGRDRITKLGQLLPEPTKQRIRALQPA